MAKRMSQKVSSGKWTIILLRNFHIHSMSYKEIYTYREIFFATDVNMVKGGHVFASPLTWRSDDINPGDGSFVHI